MTIYPGYFIKNDYPENKQVELFTSTLNDYLFPVISEEGSIESHQFINLEKIAVLLQTILSAKVISRAVNNKEVNNKFFNELENLRAMLLKDAQFMMDYDPAANSIEEVILSYPGFLAITIHRLAHILYIQKVPVIPRMMSEISHSKTGIDINPGAKIGCPFFIDHGTGVVIGETAIIGNSVKIYQGVTLGALSVKKEEATIKRHPTIEDNVVLYSGSTILGGTTTIGHNCIIGGNTWITESVKPYSVVYHKNQSVISDRNFDKEPINFII